MCQRWHVERQECGAYQKVPIKVDKFMWNFYEYVAKNQVQDPLQALKDNSIKCAK